MTKGLERVLVLVRHGQSEWNELNLFTGWKDVDLTSLGMEEAEAAGRELKRDGFRFDVAFTSELKRANRTLQLILRELGQSDIPVHRAAALNERDYGDLSGLNKQEATARWGADKVHQWRRSYDLRPPGGESLKDTAERVIPYYEEVIVPTLLEDKTVLIAAHGNSLRALIMHIEGLTPAEIEALSLRTGVPRFYRLSPDGTLSEKGDLVL